MMKHDALRFTRCARMYRECLPSHRMKPVRYVLLPYHCEAIPLPIAMKLIKIDRRYVAGIFHYRTVKNNQLLQRGTETKDAESSIILVLLAYKKETNLRIINDILRLRR